MPATVTKTATDVDISALSLPSHTEYCFTAHNNPNGLADVVAGQGVSLLNQFVFAGKQHFQQQNDVVWLQGDACTDGDFYSTQAVGISGLELEPVVVEGRSIGFVYQDACARYCRLRGLISQDTQWSRSDQAKDVFEFAKQALEAKGFAFTDTVRTWIYLDRLLEWYDDFNVVRTDFFNQHGVFEKMVPASTGIGAGTPQGAAIVMDVLAIQPLGKELSIRAVESPLQNSALDYKSSFSRAVELAYPTHCSLFISGTASIDPDGNTVHLNDPEKQIRLTMAVVHEILKSRDMGWGDLFRGIAYFKNMDWLPLYQSIAAELGIPDFPLAISHADVCRHDLLFEIEVDAVKPC